MSRSGDYEGEENFPNEWAFWQRRADQARKSKRGRKALAELREALRALPDKRLIEGALCTVGGVDRLGEVETKWQRQTVEQKIERDGEGVCAVGAYLWFKNVQAGMTPEAAFDSLPTLDDDAYSIEETAQAGVRAGLTYTLAWTLADRNDEYYRNCTPEERYEQFMAWLDSELAGVSA